MSATTSDVGRMLIRIEASTAALRGQLAEAEGRIGQFTRSTEQKLGSFERMFQSVGQNALRSITGIAAGIVAVNTVTQGLGNMARAADQAAMAAGRIGAAIGDMQAGRQIFDQIAVMAQRTGTNANDAADAFIRFNMAARQIGATRDQTMQLVETLQKVTTVSNVGAQQSSAAFMQLSQMLSGGVARAEEFNSLLENTPALVEGIAKQLNVSIGALRQMVLEGKLLNSDVLGAILRMGPEVARQFEQMPVSMTRAGNSLSQAWANLTTQLDRATGATARIAAATQGAADRVQRLAEGFVSKTATEQLRELNDEIERNERLIREAGQTAARSQAHRGAIGTGLANSAAANYGTPTQNLEERNRLLREQAGLLRPLADAEKAAADAAAATEAANAAAAAAENARQQVLQQLKAVQDNLNGTSDKTREQMAALQTIVAAGSDALRVYGISAQAAAGMLSVLEAGSSKLASTVADLNAQTREALAGGGLASRIMAAQRRAGVLDGEGNITNQAGADRVAEDERRRSEALAVARVAQARAEADLAAARRRGGEAAERLARVEQQVADFVKEGGNAAQAAALRTSLLAAAQDRNASSGQGNLQSITKVRQELTLVATAAERAADAATQGAAAERRAEQASKARAQALKVARDGTAAYTAAYREFLALIEREGRGQARQDITHRSDALRNEIALIQRETELIGALPGHREAEIAALRVRQELIATGKQFTEDEIREVEELARTRARANQAQQQAEQQLQQVRQVSAEISRDVSTALFDQMMDKDKASSVLDWFKALFRRIAIAAIQAQIVLPITQQIVGVAPGLFGATGQAGGGIGGLNLGGLFGTALGAGGVAYDGGSASGAMKTGQQNLTLASLGRYGNLGSAFTGQGLAHTGWGMADSFLNAPLVGSGGLYATTGAQTFTGMYNGQAVTAPVVNGFAVDGLTTAGAIGGGASILGGAYGIYSGIQKGGIGGGVGVVGGLAGMAGGAATIAGGIGSAAAAAGSTGMLATMAPTLAALGPYGMIAAAVLAIVSALLPGQKPSGRGQETQIDLVSAQETWRGLTGDRYSAGNREQSQAAAQSIASLAGQLGDALGGIKLYTDAAVGVTSSRGEGAGQLYLRVGDQRAEFSNNEQGGQELAGKAAEFLLNEFRKVATGDYAGILAGSADIAALQENLTWYDQVYKSFDESSVAASAFQKALDQVNTTFQAHIDKANELSLATDAITAARDKELAKITAQRDAQVKAFDLGLTIRGMQARGDSTLAQQEQIALLQFDMQAKDQLDQFRTSLEALGLAAEDVGGRIAWTEQVLADERLAIQKQYADEALKVQEAAAQEAARAAEQAAQKVQDAFRGAQASYVSALDSEIASREQAMAQVRQNVDALRSMAEALRNYGESLKLDGSLSPLTMQQRLAESQAQYAKLLAQSKSGSVEERLRAAQSLQGMAGSRLSLASSYYAPGTEAYLAEYQAVTNDIASLSTQFGMMATVEEMSLKAQQTALDVLIEQRDQAAAIGQATIENLVALRDAFIQAGTAAGVFKPDDQVVLSNKALMDRVNAAYLSANPDVAAAVASGMFKSGTDHYWQFGAGEGRAYGFATGGSFTVGGPSGVDNLTLPNLRLTAGEMVNVTRGDTMAALVAEVKALRKELAGQTTVIAQGSMAVKGEVAAQTEVLTDATASRMPVPA